MFGRILVCALLLFSVDNASAQSRKQRFKNDKASMRVGPIRINHKDSKFNPEVHDKMSYPGIFGRNHMLMVGRRPAGFGGSLGDFEVSIPRIPLVTFRRLTSRRKGALRIINHLYSESPRPSSPPEGGVFVDVDYRKVKSNGDRVTASIVRESDTNNKYAKGKIEFELLAKKKTKRKGPFGENLVTTRYQFRFKPRGFVRNLLVRTTKSGSSSSTSRVVKKARLRGSFVLTFERTVEFLD